MAKARQSPLPPSTKGGLHRWHACYALAERRLPDEDWRHELAASLREAAGVAFAAVHTCPPGRASELTHAAFPVGYADVMRAVRERFLPGIETCGEGDRYAVANFGRVYAPLEVAKYTPLATEMRALLASADVHGYVVSFLGEADGSYDGVVVLGDATPSSALLERCGPGLLGIAAVAERANADRRRVASLTGSSEAIAQQLTRREREVAELLAGGYSSLNVAARLGISEQTVAVHTRAIYRKLGVHSRVDLARRVLSRE